MHWWPQVIARTRRTPIKLPNPVPDPTRSSATSYRARSARSSSEEAVVATAHKLARVDHMLTHHEVFAPESICAVDQKRQLENDHVAVIECSITTDARHRRPSGCGSMTS